MHPPDLPPDPSLPPEDTAPRRKKPIVWLAIILAGLLGVAFVAFVVLTAIQFFTPQIKRSLVDFDVSPDGSTIVFTSASGELYTYGLLTHSVVRISPAGAGGASPRFSPDGKHIVFAGPLLGSSSWSIYEFNMENGDLHRLTLNSGVKDTNPSYSRDGTQIVFARASHLAKPKGSEPGWDDYDIWVIDTDGLELKRLTQERFFNAASPQFCSNDRGVLFQAETYGDQTPRIMLMRSSGTGGIRSLDTATTKNSNALDPYVSRDQNLIAFMSDRDSPGTFDLYVANPDGTDARPLHIANATHQNRRPVIGPDNRTFFFLAGTDVDAKGDTDYSLWATTLSGVTSELADSGLFTDPYVWGFKREVRTKAIETGATPKKP